MRRALRDESEPLTRGAGDKQPALVYLDDGELPSAVRPTGTFTVEGDRVKVSMSLRRGNQKVSFEIEGSKSDVAGLSSKIVEATARAISDFR